MDIEPNKIKEVNVDGETIYLKKDAVGWHTCFPYRNKDGSINWKNLISGGNWIKLFLIIVFVIICIGAMFEVSNIVSVANECIKNQTVTNWNLK